MHNGMWCHTYLSEASVYLFYVIMGSLHESELSSKLDQSHSISVETIGIELYLFALNEL